MTPPAAAYVANASTMPFKMFAMIQKTNDVVVPTMYMVSALHTEPISMHHFGEMMSMIFTPIALMANEEYRRHRRAYHEGRGFYLHALEQKRHDRVHDGRPSRGARQNKGHADRRGAPSFPCCSPL